MLYINGQLVPSTGITFTWYESENDDGPVSFASWYELHPTEYAALLCDLVLRDRHAQWSRNHAAIRETHASRRAGREYRSVRYARRMMPSWSHPEIREVGA